MGFVIILCTSPAVCLLELVKCLAIDGPALRPAGISGLTALTRSACSPLAALLPCAGFGVRGGHEHVSGAELK